MGIAKRAGVALAAQPFEDTPEYAWYVADGWVPYASERGLMTGVKDVDGVARRFDPDGPITRGQVATILYRHANPDSRATDDPSQYARESRFSDVPGGWYYTCVSSRPSFTKNHQSFQSSSLNFFTDHHGALGSVPGGSLPERRSIASKAPSLTQWPRRRA